MKLKHLPLIGMLLLIISFAVIPGVFANWLYAEGRPDDKNIPLDIITEGYKFNGIIYVTDAVKTSGDGEYFLAGYNGTIVTSKTTLKNNTNSTVTTKVTVYNSADEVYAFNAVKYTTENYNNADIIFTHPDIEHGDTVEPKSYIEFTVVFSYNKGVTPTNYQLNSILNFEFTPLDELPEEEEIAVSGALSQFGNILNNATISDSLSQLTTQMDNYDDNDRANGSYIGNVSGAADADVLLLENLFQENLTLVIEGVETNVTILIKRENIDGSSSSGDSQGREMTIYMTTDSLKQTGSFFSPSKAVVYAAVFTSYDDGETWAQTGEMFEGTATVKQYNGMPGSGSFDTDTWRSTDRKTISQLV